VKNKPKEGTAVRHIDGRLGYVTWKNLLDQPSDIAWVLWIPYSAALQKKDVTVAENIANLKPARQLPFTVAEKAALKAKRDEEDAQRRAESDVRMVKWREEQVELERSRWAPRRITIVNRGIVETPNWDSHPRSKNWAAILCPDPTAPGGFKRTWWERGRGQFLYIVPASLKKGDIVEFGGDYVQWSGRKRPDRWVGVVVELTETFVELSPVRSVVEAVQIAEGVSA